MSVESESFITCPSCGLTILNPKDIGLDRYCPKCQVQIWHSDLVNLLSQPVSVPSKEQFLAQELGIWYQYDYLWAIRGKDCLIEVEIQVTNNKKGIFVATIDVLSRHKEHLSQNFNQIRYYFQLKTAKEEIETWLISNDQVLWLN